MEVTGATQIGVIHDGAGTCGWPGCFMVGNERGNALAGEPADLDRTGRYRFGMVMAEFSVKPEHPQTCSEALLGMRPACQDGDDQPFSLWSYGSGPPPEAVRCPFGITPVGTGHMVGIVP